VKWLFALALFSTGCQALFPELYPDSDGGSSSSGDGGTDMAGVPHVSGMLCAMSDLRDWRTCTQLAAAGFKVEVEETTDATTTDANGNFYLMSRVPLQTATLLVIDPHGQYLETVAPINVGATPDNVGIPIVDAQTFNTLALQNGLSTDPMHGALLAWAIDTQAQPVAGQQVVGQTALYEGSAAGEMGPGLSTGAHGTFALFDQAPPSLMLTLTPPDTHTQVAIRAGAVTLTTIVVRQ
jgi:hypothetical protein